MVVVKASTPTICTKREVDSPAVVRRAYIGETNGRNWSLLEPYQKRLGAATLSAKTVVLHKTESARCYPGRVTSQRRVPRLA
jgi:hypothetical protein